MSGATRPEIPPGVRMDIERRDARLRELGITEASVVAMLLADVARDRAILRTPALFVAMLEDGHVSEGWRARRKLRKRALASLDALRDHVQACASCRAWLEVIAGMTDDVLHDRKTAPTE